MTATDRATCPACYSEATGRPIEELTVDDLNDAEEMDVSDEGMGEYYEVYIDKGHVVLEYHGVDCRNCDYDIPAFTYRHQIPTVS